MIKASELRGGNWVNSSEPIQVECLFPWGINMAYDGESMLYSFEELEPIPLTPEILQKAGFGVDIEDGGKSTNKYFIQLWNNNFLECLDDDFNDWSVGPSNSSNWIGREVKYVHQLQNLYYALYGEELEINIKSEQAA